MRRRIKPAADISIDIIDTDSFIFDLDFMGAGSEGVNSRYCNTSGPPVVVN